MDHAGAVVGPLVATALLALGLPLRTIFLATIIPGLLSVAAVMTVREPTPQATAAHEGRQPDAGGRTDPVARRLPGKLRAYFAILFLFSLGNSSDAFLLLRAKDLGVPIASLPLLWTVFHVTKLVSSYGGGSWSDRVARPKLIVFGWTIYAATYLAFGVASQPWHVWALFIVYGTYYGLTEPAEKALVKDLAPTDLRGRAYGFYNFIIGIAAVPAGLLTGWLWQAWSPRVAFGAGAAIAAVSSLGLVVWRTTDTREV
jgi:MFS family permease